MVSGWLVAISLFASALGMLVIASRYGRLLTLTALGRHNPGFAAWSGAAGAVGLIAVWQFVASLSESSGIGRVPTPAASVSALCRLLLSGDLLNDFLRSLTRIAIGFSLSLIVGGVLGILAGTFAAVNRVLVPSLSFVRYVPPTAFIAVMILYFGIGESHKYAVIFVAIVFFNFQMTVDAVQAIARPYWEMAALEQLSARKLLRWIVVPGAAPRLWDMCRINLSFAWTFLTAAELVASDGGLGTLLTRSQRFLRIDDVFAVILFFGIVGVITDTIMSRLGRRMFPWHFRQEKR